MTPVEYISASLHLALALFLLWVLLFYFWGQHRVDALREKLFVLRGELFDYAAGGGVSFTDPAYTRLRMVMNRMIRFAHRFTTTRVVLLYIFRRQLENVTPNPLAEWEKAVSLLPADQQKPLRTLHDKMVAQIVRHVITGSPLLAAIFIWCILRYLASSGFKINRHESAKQAIKEASKRLPAIEIVEAQAINAEIEEECPAGAVPA